MMRTTTGNDGPKAMILDMDGVVIDSEPLHVEADRRLFSEYGITIESEDWLGFKGLTLRAVFELVRSKYGFPEDFEIFHTKKDTYLAEAYERELRLFSDFQSFIERFKEAFVFALTTSSHRPLTELVLTKFQLKDIFQVVITSDDVVKGKPDPEPYAKTIEALGLEPPECVAIEDSINGIQSAKGAGARCVAVATSFESLELVEADVVVHRLEDITEDIISSL